MKPSIYTLIFFVLIFSSCQKEYVTKNDTKLDYFIESFDIDGLGFTPQLKVTYQYDASGKLLKYTVLSYSLDTEALEEQRYFTLLYSDNKVESIQGYLPDATTSYIEYAYQYFPNDAVSKIIETNHSTGINSEANFTYAESGTVKVAYSFSNGGSFEYEFDYASGNILSDKTTRGAQLCNEGHYTYDQQKNPFKSLGYVDYLLTNLSVNNKLTENINYAGCSFPSFIPESYIYEYNDAGYPTSATTFYKSDGVIAKSKKEFFYTLH